MWHYAVFIWYTAYLDPPIHTYHNINYIMQTFLTCSGVFYYKGTSIW